MCIMKNRRSVSNKSLRLVASHILGHAKRSISTFASLIKKALIKEHIFCQLVATDTDSLFFFIYGEYQEQFNDRVQCILAKDKDFNTMMDYSNYLKTSPWYNSDNQKKTHHFQNEAPDKQIINVIALASKCYKITFADNSNKYRAKGFPQQHLEVNHYMKAVSLFKLNHYFNNSVEHLARHSTTFAHNRLYFTPGLIRLNTIWRYPIGFTTFVPIPIFIDLAR